jgi:glycosyltransferase involved in cell wall biosynthesis
VKIAYLSGSVVPSRAANSVHVMKMCNAFAAIGCEPLLLAVDNDAADPIATRNFYGVDHAFPIHWIPRPGRRAGSLVHGCLSARAAIAAKPELVYGRDVRACWAVSMISSVPIVLEMHHPIQGGSTSAHWMFRRLVARRNFLGVVVISRALEKHYGERYPVLRNRVHVAPDGADSPRLGWRPVLPPAKGRLRVGYVGHLYPGRGIELILELAKRCPWAEFHLVGGMESDLAGWRHAIRDIPGITLHGFRPPVETDGFRAAMDVLLAPYQTQVSVAQVNQDTCDWMSPLKIFEYMAAEKAIIASDLPVIREVLSEDNAFLVAPDRVDGWFAALSRLRDRSLRERLGGQAYRDFQARYTWRRRAELIREQVREWTGRGLQETG